MKKLTNLLPCKAPDSQQKNKRFMWRMHQEESNSQEELGSPHSKNWKGTLREEVFFLFCFVLFCFLRVMFLYKGPVPKGKVGICEKRECWDMDSGKSLYRKARK